MGLDRGVPVKIRFWVTLVAVALLAVGYFLWHWKQDAGTPVSTGFAASGVQEYSTATAVLETLPVHEKAESTGYSRKLFGDAWADIDHNGCDQRNDVLARDLTEITRAKNCRVLSGELHDPYTAATISFTRGEATSAEVPIDHVVALSNAWQTGATLLSEADRAKLANDPLNLQATGRKPNTEKSDQDAATWLPQGGYRCEYVGRQISVKAAYSLWVTPEEKRAMEQVLETCPDQPAYRSAYRSR